MLELFSLGLCCKLCSQSKQPRTAFGGNKILTKCGALWDNQKKCACFTHLHARIVFIQFLGPAWYFFNTPSLSLPPKKT
jgi:hypothetical protein